MEIKIKKQVEEVVEIATPCYRKDSASVWAITENEIIRVTYAEVCHKKIEVWDADLNSYPFNNGSVEIDRTEFMAIYARVFQTIDALL